MRFSWTGPVVERKEACTDEHLHVSLQMAVVHPASKLWRGRRPHTPRRMAGFASYLFSRSNVAHSLDGCDDEHHNEGKHQRAINLYGGVPGSEAQWSDAQHPCNQRPHDGMGSNGVFPCIARPTFRGKVYRQMKVMAGAESILALVTYFRPL